MICSICKRRIPDEDLICFTCYEDAMNPKKPCAICKKVLTDMDLCEECAKLKNTQSHPHEDYGCDYKWEK
jgi:hypothetical protein